MVRGPFSGHSTNQIYPRSNGCVLPKTRKAPILLDYLGHGWSPVPSHCDVSLKVSRVDADGAHDANNGQLLALDETPNCLFGDAKADCSFGYS